MKKKSLLKRSDVIRMREMIKGIEGVRGLVSGARPSVILIWIFFSLFQTLKRNRARKKRRDGQATPEHILEWVSGWNQEGGREKARVEELAGEQRAKWNKRRILWYGQ